MWRERRIAREKSDDEYVYEKKTNLFVRFDGRCVDVSTERRQQRHRRVTAHMKIQVVWVPRS